MPSRSLILALIFVATVIAYASVRTATFVYEDADGVAAYNFDPPHPANWWQRSRPLAWLSFSLDSWMGHKSPEMFHLTNLALHLANGGLVYGVATAIGAGPAVAVLTTYVFLLHPLQTEAVAYVSERTELLATFWILAATLAALTFTRGRAWVVALCLGLALASKESAMIGVVLLLTALTLRGRLSRRVVVRIGVVGGLLSAVLLLRVWQTSYVPGLRSPFGWLSFWEWQATAVWRYVALVVYPTGQSVDHDFEIVPHALQLLALLTLLTAAIGLGLAWLGRYVLWTDRRADLLVFGLVWAAIDLAPRFVMRITEAVNEHQMYRPMVGLSLTIAQGLVWLYPSLRDLLSPRSLAWPQPS